ncbi:Hsp70 family protein [Caballeronia sp. LZ029]|uniref:Hsp70 family protein n=1 Tax=Caballeronia sp. LZ029 TaxID=3038564 RepID=UPI0028603AB3|nr:Hsp70 family protein [Caballeronia sp. LZ029]MDR5746460.1 Hsp70 family protein [Caballeronia sp. LZ029]
MKHYVGIDLGTTNSAICSYDGTDICLYKSPDQNDVTPSAIFVDRRNNKYVGKRAYDNTARNPESGAVLFKRFMGTSTPIHLTAANVTMTPEACSAEILRVLYGYLPEGIRNDPDTGTVITVPAAFNQMQKDATMAAAEQAGLGKVALMQEPVAAVMTVMRQRKGDGMFLVYDLGGGTLDIAIAESINGRVSLLSHGGIAMCGGRDFDRLLLDNVAKPWLLENFNLPENFSSDPRYATLRHMASWAIERAKIELSSNEESIISLDDSELRMRDESGTDIYLDIPLTRTRFDDLIADRIEESIQAARDAMSKANVSPHDIGRVVFVGGPTQYKPLRDKVAFELGIAASTDVRPMTAVAEGAAVFAESIDWSSGNRGRKSGRGALAAGGALDLTFNYQARTPDAKAKIVAKVGGKITEGAAFQIDSLDTGWSSGRVALKNAATIEVPLAKPGENHFKVFVFDAAGGPLTLNTDRIVIARTAAQIDAIPASHSIGVEARGKIGGRVGLEYLVREGDQLPKRGTVVFKADETLSAGGTGSINFKLWEGEIEDPVADNRFIGKFSIEGRDFDSGVVVKGAELICEYEINDSGAIVLEVSVPSIGGSFNSGRNFYSRLEAQIDFTKAAHRIEDEAARLDARLREFSSLVEDDVRLSRARERIARAAEVRGGSCDPESAKQAMDDLQEAKRLMAQVRKENAKVIRRMELDKTVSFFDAHVRQFGRPAEITSFDNLARTAQRAIESHGDDFESHLSEMRSKNFVILWRQDWFVIDRFKWLSEDASLFPDAQEHLALCRAGQQAMQNNEIDKLRSVVSNLDAIRIYSSAEDDMIAASNILVG